MQDESCGEFESNGVKKREKKLRSDSWWRVQRQWSQKKRKKSIKESLGGSSRPLGPKKEKKSMAQLVPTSTVW